jgi:hypothetical protein
MPIVDQGVEDARQELFKQYETMLKERPLEDVDMAPELTILISDRFSVLLWIVLCALTIHAKTSDTAVYEAEARLTWDVLNYYFYVKAGEPVSPQVLYASHF